MKNIKCCLIILAAMMVYSATGQVTVTGTAYTEIVQLSTANETMQLNFGRFSPSAGGGSITISPEGIRMAYGNVELMEGSYNQGVFKITGSENNSLNVVLPVTAQLLYHNNSINTISLDKWTYNIPKTGSGDITVNIGATLNFGSLEYNPTGLYMGTYQIIFSYN